MTTQITKAQVDLVQGESEDNAKFGYVAGDDGGFFFTWRPTLNATLASVEEDEVDGDGGLEESEVVDFLREYLPTTKRGREMWLKQYECEIDSGEGGTTTIDAMSLSEAVTMAAAWAEAGEWREDGEVAVSVSGPDGDDEISVRVTKSEIFAE
jgi:hypothetical protein